MKKLLVVFGCVALVSGLWISESKAKPPPQETREDIVCRGLSGIGFSYWWGGECWCGKNCKPDLTNCKPGSCSGSCPGCSHHGKYGADCSGFVSKAWQTPKPSNVRDCHVERHVAKDFTNKHQNWSIINMNSLQPGDAAAYSKHVVLIVGGKDSAGKWDVAEASGCSTGIIHHRRTFASSYNGAQRINLNSCVCNANAKETTDCGNCGKKTRECANGCTWSDWSACEGSDPTANTSCTVEGGKGICAAGMLKCVGGWFTCEPTQAREETCDGLDNDCDGVVDNGTPASLGENQPCNSSCGSGTTLCKNGKLVCVPEGKTWPDITCDKTPDAAVTDAAADANTFVRDAPLTPPSEGGKGHGDWPDQTETSDGCGCHIPTSSKTNHSILLMLGLTALGLARRRR